MKVKNAAELRELKGEKEPVVQTPSLPSPELLLAIKSLAVAVRDRPLPEIAKPARKWKFTVLRNEDGFTSEVIAEAIE